MNSVLDNQGLAKFFQNISQLTHVTKYRSFQYRQLCNAVLLNNRLLHMKRAPNILCHYCKTTKENVPHFYFECNIVRRFWLDIQNLIEEKLDEKCTITLQNVFICNVHSQIDHAVNLIILVAKQMLYQWKWLKQKTSIIEVENKIEFIRKIK